MSAALALKGTSSKALRYLLGGDKIAPYVGLELTEQLAQPLVFQWAPAVSKQPPAIIHGYNVTMLIDICKAIGKAHEEGKLLARQERIFKQAQVILNASAKAGIKGLASN